MTKDECKSAILSFKFAVENYKRTLLNRDNIYSDSVQANLIDTQSSQLNQTYGKLEKYINKIGGGIGMTYITAFGMNDTYSDMLSAASFVVQDLDLIIGRLDGMSEKEFEAALLPKPDSQSAAHRAPAQGTIHDLKNPHRQYWAMLGKLTRTWLKENKVASGILTAVIAGLLVLYVWSRLTH